MRGTCTCGARVEVAQVDGAWATPGHVCGRGTASAFPLSPPQLRSKNRKSSVRTGSSPFAPVAALQGRTLRLWLPRAVRSAEGPNGRVWRLRARAAREWRQLVAAALEVLGDRRPRWERAAVHYELFTRGAEIDPDNRVALGKPILDGLVLAGVLPDDRGAHVVGPTAAWARTPLPWGFVVVRIARSSPSR